MPETGVETKEPACRRRRARRFPLPTDNAGQAFPRHWKVPHVFAHGSEHYPHIGPDDASSQDSQDRYHRRMRTVLNVAGALVVAGAACGQDGVPPAPEAPAQQSAPSAAENDPFAPSTVEILREEAAKVLKTVACAGTRRLLIATNWLPVLDPRRLFFNRAEGRAIGPAAWESLPETERAGYKELNLDERYYYFTRYGSPLAYARVLDLACEKFGCDVACFEKKRVLDFGYGGIGHLRLLASIGAKVVGVEVDPVLKELYSRPGDTGEIKGVGMGNQVAPDGSLTLLHGRWPADEDVRAAAGAEYDLIISKNTLKRGYIHPAKDVDKRMLIDLGVDDAGFVGAVAASLKPGGLFVIYNICPKQSEENYIPWADGQCPFDRSLFDAAGLDVLEFDRDDSVAVRTLGRALGWDRGENPMDLENDTFAWVTIVRKK